MRNIRVCRTPGGFSPDMDQGWQWQGGGNPFQLIARVIPSDTQAQYTGITSGSPVQPTIRYYNGLWHDTYDLFSYTTHQAQKYFGTNGSNPRWIENSIDGHQAIRLEAKGGFSYAVYGANEQDGFVISYAYEPYLIFPFVATYVFVPRIDMETGMGKWWLWTNGTTSNPSGFYMAASGTLVTQDYMPNITGSGSPGSINVFTLGMLGGEGAAVVTGDHNCVAFLNTTGSAATADNWYLPSVQTDYIGPCYIGGHWRLNYPMWRYATDTWDLLDYSYYRASPDARSEISGVTFGSHVKQLHWNACRKWGLLR